MFKVYWTELTGEPCAQSFTEMKLALEWTEFVRQQGRTYVTMVSENPSSIGKSGVDSVVDGVLPDGNIYDWKKRR